MDDLISRQDAIDIAYPFDDNERHLIDALESLPSAQPEPITVNIDHELTQEEYEKLRKDMANAPIMLLPAAQPEQRWIPCSERLPKSGRYLVTGKKNRDWYESDKIVTAAFYDGEFWTDNGDIQAEAWMPLPEPYKGEES